ncbi:MAG: hypothetical protein IJI53_07045 [Clostridia bacterium]|nr:hypothetical protein [Clostridia bacterium]
MLFEGRFNKARKLQQEEMEGKERAFDQENLSDLLEKNDTLALILSALITILPVALLALGVISLLGYLFVVR